MEEIFRVTTSVNRNKGTVRYGGKFRADRIWQANKDQPGNEVKVEVMTGEFRDVTEKWRAGNYESTQEIGALPAEAVPAESADSTDHGSDVGNPVHAVSGTGWPE